MLVFEPLSIKDIQKVSKYIQKSDNLCSDLSVGSLFMWWADKDLHFCIWNDTLTVKIIMNEQPAFSWPVGESVSDMINELQEYAKENHLPLRFFAIDDKTLEKIQNDKRLKNPMWAYDRKWSDYIYSAEEMKTFKGRKFNGQRNHINNFKKLYGEPNIRFLTSEDLPGVEKMLEEYKFEHTDKNKLESFELKQTKKLLSVYESLGMYAAGLFVGDEIAAFTIGEVMGDMLIISVEKALRRYKGAYPTLYSGFVNLMDKELNSTLKIVNREDDSGDIGLRTSKLQYHPIGLVNKYIVHIDAPIKRVETLPEIDAKSVVLTPFRKTDKKAYLDLNLDIENNRYWGYDYRKDGGITEPLTEDTFYNDTMFDIEVGDSINFAIRKSRDGEMIGEVILWNFTADNYCELGCRIKHCYHNLGYGKAAFKAAADFAEKTLGLKVYAKCFHENLPSYKMITSSGFTPSYKTETHQYFSRKENL